MDAGRVSRPGAACESDAISAAALYSHLQLLEVERMYASVHLADDQYYIEDLLDEIAAARRAYVTQAVTEIATLRGALWGPQRG